MLAIDKGFSLKDIGTILHAKLHQDFGSILDKVQVTLYTKKEDVDKLTKTARAEYKTRDERVESMTDESVETFYSCTLCQSFAPSHVCMVSPEEDRAVRGLQLDGLQGLLRDQSHGSQPAREKGRGPGPRVGAVQRGQRLCV